MINIHHKGIRCKIMARAKSSLKGSVDEEIGDFIYSWGVPIGAATLQYNLAILQKVKYIIAM